MELKIDVSEYLQYIQDLPYYPYSVLGVGVFILLLLIVLLALRKRSASPKQKTSRNSKAAKNTPVRGLPVDGLSAFGEVDLTLIESIKNSPMGVVVLPTEPVAPPKPPVDPALLEAAVKTCLQKFQEMYIEMYIGLGLMSDFERMRTEVTRRIEDAKETYHSLSELNMTPEGFVLLQMASVSGNILQSGEQHIGQGLLGIHGQELFTVYRYALNTMQEKGCATQEEVQGKMNFMERKVQELG